MKGERQGGDGGGTKIMGGVRKVVKFNETLFGTEQG